MMIGRRDINPAGLDRAVVGWMFRGHIADRAENLWQYTPGAGGDVNDNKKGGRGRLRKFAKDFLQFANAARRRPDSHHQFDAHVMIRCRPSLLLLFAAAHALCYSSCPCAFLPDRQQNTADAVSKS